jgi:cytidylate kinase
MAIITISREPGALGEEVAARIAGQLGFMLVDKARLAQLWKEKNLDETEMASEDDLCSKCMAVPETEARLRMVPQLILQLAMDHDLVVVGRGAQGLFHNRPGTLHVRLVAPRPFRVRQLQSLEGLSASTARRRIKDLELQRYRYVRFLYRLNWADPCLYDMVVRMDRLNVEQALSLIVAAFHEMRLIEIPRSRILSDKSFGAVDRSAGYPFVNAAEREFARFLEFYGIPYEYEPRTFPLEINAEGRIVEAFTPDFYLPEQDTYIELTTMKQSLVTRKNRKVRKLKRLYPDVNIRIFYERDFSSLLAKYDLLATKVGKDVANSRTERPLPEAETTANGTQKSN